MCWETVPAAGVAHEAAARQNTASNQREDLVISVKYWLEGRAPRNEQCCPAQERSSQRNQRSCCLPQKDCACGQAFPQDHITSL